MNLPQAAHLLGDIPIIEVRYGNHILQRANSQLLSTQYFVENQNGIEILKQFDTLPNVVRNKLRNLTVLNEEEVKLFVDDIKTINTRLVEENEKQDGYYVGFISLLIWFTLFYSVYKTMVYIFTVESSGEHTEGFIYSLIVGILKTIKDFLLNG